MESFHEDSYWTKRRKIHARVASHLGNVQDHSVSESQSEQNVHDLNDVTSDTSSCETFECSETNNASTPDANEHELNDVDLVDQMSSNDTDMSTVHEFVVSEFANHSDTESECFSRDFESDTSDSDVTDENSTGMPAKLAEWANEFKIPHVALQKLLFLLRPSFPNLPKDPRTLLHTLRHYDIQCMSGGLYHHFGIAQGINQTLPSELKNMPNLDCIHIQVNIDGLPIFKSTKAQFWPILGKIVKPVASDPFIIGLFSGNQKPGSIHEYLDDFITEMQHIEQHGLDIDGFEENPSLYLSCFICDAPARAFVKCVKGHNAYYGCDKCTQKGVWQEKVTFPETDAPLRTDVAFDEMAYANTHCVGENHSPLSRLSFGMVSQFPLDPMHLVFLGVVKRLILNWLRGPVVNKCRIGANAISRISELLLSCHQYLPREFPRKCRSLADVDRWKATEFRQFILYSGIVVLKGTISEVFYQHFLHFFVGIYCLSSPLHYATHCEYANDQLLLFVQQWGKFYGTDIVYNVHSLTHLAGDVMMFGPLDDFSAFPFENFLGKLKKLLRKPKFPLAQVIRRLSEIQGCNIAKKRNHGHSFLKPHILGPLPLELKGFYQFKGVYHTDLYFSIEDGNNCVKVGSQYGLIRNIVCKELLYSDQSEPAVIFEPFESFSDFFSDPLKSSDLGIVKVTRPSGHLKVVSMSQIACKYVRLPYKDKFVIVPLLHQFC